MILNFDIRHNSFANSSHSLPMMSVLQFRFNLDTKTDAQTRQFEKRRDETISDQR